MEHVIAREDIYGVVVSTDTSRHVRGDRSPNSPNPIEGVLNTEMESVHYLSRNCIRTRSTRAGMCTELETCPESPATCVRNCYKKIAVRMNRSPPDHTPTAISGQNVRRHMRIPLVKVPLDHLPSCCDLSVFCIYRCCGLDLVNAMY